MRRPRLSATLLLVGVLLVGAVGGAALATLVITRRLTALFEGSPKLTMARLYGWSSIAGCACHPSSAPRSSASSPRIMRRWRGWRGWPSRS